jgi:TRAP-type mannitol/chloroaromatic compound transport system permease large subunit
MIDLIAHNLAPIMFVSVMAMLLLGYPVAFTLAAGGLLFFVIGVEVAHIAPEQINLFWPLLQANPERIYGVMSSETLLAIPFFTFMGIILERSRMAEDLLDTIGQLFGPIRGGLAFAAVFVGALLAATTGVVAASVIAMGLISLPIMMRYGYDSRVATGTIAAAGSLAQVIPPSLVLIVMADQLGRSVGDMYVGAVIPGLLLVAFYCLYVFVITIVRPKAVPALPIEARTLGGGIVSLIVILVISAAIYVAAYNFVFDQMRYETRVVSAATLATVVAYGFSLANRRFKFGLLSRLAEQVVIVLIPPLALIFLVLGTIFLGIATPTEGGAMGATGALALALAKRRLSLTTLKQALDSTTKLSSFVMFILIGARIFGLTFYGVNGNVWMEELLLALPGGEYGFLIVVTIIIFILGCFLDFFEIAFILVPLLGPVAEKLGIDLIWFGLILGINLQASFLTPPFGFALFYLRSIAPDKEWLDEVTGRRFPGIRTADIYRGALPFIGIQVVVIALVIAFPRIVTHYKDVGPAVTPSEIQIEAPNFGSGGGPNFGSDNSGAGPNFGADNNGAGAGPNFGGAATPAPAGPNFGGSSSGESPGPNFGTPSAPDTGAPAAPNFGAPATPNFGTGSGGADKGATSGPNFNTGQ